MDILCEKKIVIIVVDQNERKRKEANTIIILCNHLFKISFFFDRSHFFLHTKLDFILLAQTKKKTNLQDKNMYPLKL